MGALAKITRKFRFVLVTVCLSLLGASLFFFYFPATKSEVRSVAKAEIPAPKIELPKSTESPSFVPSPQISAGDLEGAAEAAFERESTEFIEEIIKQEVSSQVFTNGGFLGDGRYYRQFVVKNPFKRDDLSKIQLKLEDFGKRFPDIDQSAFMSEVNLHCNYNDNYKIVSIQYQKSGKDGNWRPFVIVYNTSEVAIEPKSGFGDYYTSGHGDGDITPENGQQSYLQRRYNHWFAESLRIDTPAIESSGK